MAWGTRAGAAMATLWAGNRSEPAGHKAAATLGAVKIFDAVSDRHAPVPLSTQHFPPPRDVYRVNISHVNIPHCLRYCSAVLCRGRQKGHFNFRPACPPHSTPIGLWGRCCAGPWHRVCWSSRAAVRSGSWRPCTARVGGGAVGQLEAMQSVRCYRRCDPPKRVVGGRHLLTMAVQIESKNKS